MRIVFTVSMRFFEVSNVLPVGASAVVASFPLFI
jgi:hypothetical protein